MKTAAVTCVLSTRRLAGIQPCSVHSKHAWSIRRASYDFFPAIFSKNDTWVFLQLSGEQLVSQRLPVFAADDPQDGPVRSRVYRAKTHSRCREIRSLPGVQTNLLPAGLSGFLAFCLLAPSQVKSHQREGQIVPQTLQNRSVCVWGGGTQKSSFI